MRAVIQRVSRARVVVDGRTVGEIDAGLCVLVGALAGDDQSDVDFMARKLSTLRVFHDQDGKMNRSVMDTGGSILLVSQFTLAADTTSGTRPSFTSALEPEKAQPMLEELANRLQSNGICVETGLFGARMLVELTNEGPVTIFIDSRDKRRK